MVVTIQSLGHPRRSLIVLRVAIRCSPARTIVGGRDNVVYVVSEHVRAAVVIAVNVLDHGDALSPGREETTMTIEFERTTINSIFPACYARRT